MSETRANQLHATAHLIHNDLNTINLPPERAKEAIVRRLRQVDSERDAEWIRALEVARDVPVDIRYADPQQYATQLLRMLRTRQAEAFANMLTRIAIGIHTSDQEPVPEHLLVERCSLQRVEDAEGAKWVGTCEEDQRESVEVKGAGEPIKLSRLSCTRGPDFKISHPYQLLAHWPSIISTGRTSDWIWGRGVTAGPAPRSIGRGWKSCTM